MLISFLFIFLFIVVGVLLILNVALPLINTRYCMFWMFRKNRFIEAANKLEEAKRERDILNLEKETEKIKHSPERH